MCSVFLPLKIRGSILCLMCIPYNKLYWVMLISYTRKISHYLLLVKIEDDSKLSEIQNFLWNGWLPKSSRKVTCCIIYLFDSVTEFSLHYQKKKPCKNAAWRESEHQSQRPQSALKQGKCLLTKVDVLRKAVLTHILHARLCVGHGDTLLQLCILSREHIYYKYNTN